MAVKYKEKVTSPDGSKGTLTVHWKHLQPGDCCSPTQVQDQQSSVQNQQDPRKDLADKIRTYWHKMQM